MKLTTLSILVLSLFIFGCSESNNPVIQDELIFSKNKITLNSFLLFDNLDYNKNKYLKINDSLSLGFLSETYHRQNLITDIKVRSGRNKIKNHGNEFYFISGDSVGFATISYRYKTNQDELFTDSLRIYVYRQFVMLKADDLTFQNNLVSNKWEMFIDYIIDNELSCGIGIIGASLEKGNLNYHNYIKALIKSNYFEIWNHGYEHIVGGRYLNGDYFSEFKNTSYEFQKSALDKTQNLCKEYLNFTPIAFGAPGNAYDDITSKVISENSELKIWFYGMANSNKMVIQRDSEVEFPVGNPIYYNFINNYKFEVDLLALQIHPNMWDKNKFEEFRKIIEFLKSQNVTFVTPSEYYFLVSSQNSNE